jgi:hypothetical protein
MTKQELKSALETIIASHPIPTLFACGNKRSTRDLFAVLTETDRGYRVTVECNYTTRDKAALEILWAIRNDLARLGDTSLRSPKKANRAGYWHMGSFDTTSMSREFYSVAESIAA